MSFRKHAASLSSLLGICAALISWTAGAAERPNVIVVVADDLGWNAGSVCVKEVHNAVHDGVVRCSSRRDD